jgi:cytochrome c-type biogenesis protein CcmH/NrfF
VPSNPAHHLYDCACELLDAAQRLRAAAHRRGTEEAIAATLGCMGVAVEELATSSQELADELRRTRIRSDGQGDAAVQTLERLTEQLLGARHESDRARARLAERDIVSA